MRQPPHVGATTEDAWAGIPKTRRCGAPTIRAELLERPHSHTHRDRLSAGLLRSERVSPRLQTLDRLVAFGVPRPERTLSSSNRSQRPCSRISEAHIMKHVHQHEVAQSALPNLNSVAI